MIKENASCITINCGCCGGETGGGAGVGGGIPVGTVITYMGSKVPEHYLACDGAVLNIADYEALSSQIKDEFGNINFFGGDGIATFSVPDLRNRFLRGYRGEAAEQLSGEVGVHQEATSAPIFQVWADGVGSIAYSGGKPTKHLYPRDVDSHSPVVKGCSYTNSIQTSDSNNGDNWSGLGTTYTSRPTNVAVLYCIKFE